MRMAVLAMGVVLSGCAAPQPKVVSAGERSVIVQVVNRDVAAAQAAADKACSVYGRKARLHQQIEPVQYVYDCVL